MLQAVLGGGKDQGPAVLGLGFAQLLRRGQIVGLGFVGAESRVGRVEGLGAESPSGKRKQAGRGGG